jgi:hypothetical protein
MKKYYPSWYRRYPSCGKGMSYLTDYAQFRWTTGKGSVLDDPDLYQNKTAKEILQDLYDKK